MISYQQIFIQKKCKSLLQFSREGYSNLDIEYQKAAIILKYPSDTDDEDTISNPIQLAKIDCDKNSRSVKKYNITKYPQIFLFKSGVKYEYSGNLTAFSIVNWARLRKGPHIYNFQECSDILRTFDSGIMGHEDSLVIYFPSQSQNKIDEVSQWNIYYQTVSLIEEIFDKILFTSLDDRECGLTLYDDSIFNIHPSQALIVMMKKFDPDNTIAYQYDKLSDFKLADWLVINSIPPLVKFDPKYMHHIIGVSSASIVLFAPNEGLENQDYFQVFQEASEYYRGKHIFVHVDLSDQSEQVQMLKELIGIQYQPSLMIIEPSDQQNLKKFQYEYKQLEIITMDKFKQFMTNYKNNLLIPFFKNQNITETIVPSSNIEQINGNRFRQIIVAKIDQIKGQEFLINFKVDWCPHCSQMTYMLEQYFQKTKIPNLFVGQIDLTKNELGFDFEIQGYPTLYFWSENSKFNQPIEFKYQRTVENLDEFLRNHSSTYALYLKSQDSKEDEQEQKIEESNEETKIEEKEIKIKEDSDQKVKKDEL